MTLPAPRGPIDRRKRQQVIHLPRTRLAPLAPQRCPVQRLGLRLRGRLGLALPESPASPGFRFRLGRRSCASCAAGTLILLGWVSGPRGSPVPLPSPYPIVAPGEATEAREESYWAGRIETCLAGRSEPTSSRLHRKERVGPFAEATLQSLLTLYDSTRRQCPLLRHHANATESGSCRAPVGQGGEAG